MLTLTDYPELSEKLHLSGDLGTYAAGPFLLTTPAGWERLSVDLVQSGLNITVWDGHMGVEFTEEEFEPSVSEDGTTITFKSKLEDNGNYTITPVSPEDLSESYTFLKFSSDEEAIRVTRGLIRRMAGLPFGVVTGGKLTDLGLVMEDGIDKVRGLYLINRDGTFRRENGTWVAIDPEDEEANEEIEGGVWIEALEGIKAVFDEKENQDSLQLKDFNGYIL